MLHLYNTLTRKKEEFIPINPGKVSMYTCGPTVYSYVHIGNLRAYTNADLLRRYLMYCGFEVLMIKNITDVGHLTEDDIAQGDSGEDKMMKAAKKEQKTPQEIARFYEAYAKEKEAEMNILPAQFFPRATEHIPQMIAIITTLIAKGYAYESNGNVFFDVEKFSNYGKLSGNSLEKLNIGARLEDPHPDKKHQWDFALWLTAPDNHIMKWDSPWSIGYPGWHIECSAMSMEYLSTTFDIHTGGADNIFPHHEAEIAQSESANGVTFVHYWIHSQLLQVDGNKMSKSKENFYTLEDIKEHGFTPMDLRMIYLLSHYRSPMNFTWDTMQQAQKNLDTINNFLQRCANYIPDPVHKKIPHIINTYRTHFEQAMDDDLNTPQALTVLFELITDTHTHMDNKTLSTTEEITKFLIPALTALGLISEKKDTSVPDIIQKLAQEREVARTEKDFARSDTLRDQITAQGYEIMDDANGFTLHKK